jgi:hypothetical protein
MSMVVWVERHGRDGADVAHAGRLWKAASRGSASDQAEGASPVKRTLSALFRRRPAKVNCAAVH